MAREKHPGQKNNLDALCKRYEVDNSQRDLHGALLDAQILLDVYLAMTGGQETMGFDAMQEEQAQEQNTIRLNDKERKPLPIIEPNAEELAAHEKYLEMIKEQSGGECVWVNAGHD